jgi:hypothetical protein
MLGTLRIRNPQDFWCGIFFVALGALAIYAAHHYPVGTAFEMGPGYFPIWLGGIMIALGLAIGALSLRLQGESDQGVRLSDWDLRPWIVLTSTLAAYALLMDAGVGFVPSLMVLVIGCALAHKDVRWRETILLSVLVTAAAVAVFSFGLDLPYRLFWWSD